MASVTPDLRLPSQPQGITAHWLIPNYTAWWQRLMCVNNLPRVALNSGGQDSNTRPTDRKSSVLTTRALSHTWNLMLCFILNCHNIICKWVQFWTRTCTAAYVCVCVYVCVPTDRQSVDKVKQRLIQVWCKLHQDIINKASAVKHWARVCAIIFGISCECNHNLVLCNWLSHILST